MNILKRIFKKSVIENPYYIKLKRALLRSGQKFEIKEAYYLLGLPDTFENRQELRAAITQNMLINIKNDKVYDVMADNLELYFVKDVNNKCCLIVLLDPYELYAPEDILDIIPAEDKSFEFDPELIYKRG